MNKQNEPRTAAGFVNQAFADAKALLKTAVSPQQLHIWGGSIDETNLKPFLQSWDNAKATLEWAMIEEISRFYTIDLTHFTDVLANGLNLLERARLFGEYGDLSLRREGQTFSWSFIGDTSQPWPPKPAETADFWQQHPRTILREVERTYRQWEPEDKRVNPDWHKQIGLTGKQLELVQKHYIENGRIAFVRYVRFQEM